MAHKQSPSAGDPDNCNPDSGCCERKKAQSLRRHFPGRFQHLCQIAGKQSPKHTFNNQNQSKSDKEILHYFFLALAPNGSLKKRKKSVFGEITKRVPSACKPFS